VLVALELLGGVLCHRRVGRRTRRPGDSASSPRSATCECAASSRARSMSGDR
jgi:hypothetical protein